MNNNSTVVEILKKNLFSIQPVISEVDRKLLGLAYTPGVGATCLDIQKNPLLADQFTFRARAIAVVTDGSFLDVQGKRVMPAIDWIIYQIKQYTGLDAFPFIVSKNIDLDALLKDLSNSYGTVLYLDSKQPKDIPKDLLFIKHQEILAIHKTQRTDFNYTSTAIAYFLHKGIKGHPDRNSYQTASVSPPFKKIFKTQPFVIQGEDVEENSRRFHRQYQGKIRIVNNQQISFNDMKSVFTEENILAAIKSQNIYTKTSKIAVIVTDGTAILGFGDIGPRAGLPVMQGKSLLFKLLGDVEVVPFCIQPRKTAQQEVQAIYNSILNFMAVNLEDIKAPQCFDIETGLKEKGLLPIFHDDQHGTAIVVLAALINALKVAGKDPSAVKIVINGAGAAGITIAKLILAYKIENLIVCDTKGTIYAGRKEGMNKAKEQIALLTNKSLVKGNLEFALEKADVFIGVSAAGALKGHLIKQKMNEKAIIFALANPTPQILPDEAKKNNAFIYGSGRSDFENQINNSLVFPGIFKSIKQHHLKEITGDMKLRAAIALSNSLEHEPNRQYIIPASLNKKLAQIISDEVGKGF